MTKLKSAVRAVVAALASPTLRPAEAAIIRAVIVAVVAAFGIQHA
jgi:hypothetical protein